jgi:tetratricopeptide (TPR) repeat protein
MPHNTQIMTYIGQMSRLEGNYDEAEQWYKKAIETNYIDYMPHWFLANVYASKGNNQAALHEIAIALVLNRNNPRILDFITKLSASSDLQYLDWKCDPQYVITKDKDTVRINIFDKDWSAYAATKAVWLYEPGYKEKRTNNKDLSILSSYEELECLSNTLTSYKDSHPDMGDKPTIVGLSRAFEKGMKLEFVFFEIWLRDYPHVIYEQKKEFIDKVADYVLDNHVRAK